MRYCIYYYAGVQIGFQQTLYSVDESTGLVVLSVRVLSGILTNEVIVELNTNQDTAIGI